MGIGELIKRTVLAEFRADVSQATREIDSLISKHERLKGATQAAAKGQAAHFDQLVLDLTRSNKAAEDGAMSWDGWKKSSDSAKASHEQLLGAITKGAVVFGTIAAAVDFAMDALKSYGEQVRLETKTAGINMDELGQSFDGLISHHELLQFAAQTSTGVLKLNQQQMETVGQAALALRDRGHDLSESFEKLKDAVVKGKVDGLDDLGLSIQQGSSKAETLKNLMTELNKVIADSGPHTKNAADDVDRLAAGWDNAKESLKKYTAEFIMDIADSQMSLDKMDEMAGKVWLHESQAFGAFQSGIESGRGQVRYQQGMHNFAVGFNRGKQQVLDSQVIEMDDLNVGRTDEERKKMAEDAITREAKAILRAAIASSDRNVASAGGFARSGTSLGAAADMTVRDSYGAEQDLLGDAISRTDEAAQATLAEQGSRDSRYASSYSGRTQSYLETMFGPIEDFKAYETAFGSLQLATSSAMGAWISGSMSLGLAIKKGIGDALGALASQLAVESLKHGAYAIGSLAFGDFSGAARHGAAAAAFGSGAVAAAVAARKLGSSVQAELAAQKDAGGGASSGASGGGSSGGGGGGSGGGGVINHYTIVYGESFYSESARMKQLDADRMVRQALGSSYVEHS
jgi:hypothetical protein